MKNYFIVLGELGELGEKYYITIFIWIKI